MPKHYYRKLLVGSLVLHRRKPGNWLVCDMWSPEKDKVWIRKLGGCLEEAALVPRRELREQPLHLTVNLVHGPDARGQGWSFISIRPGGEVDSKFTYPADAELDAESLTQEAWDQAEHPNRVEEIHLSVELQRLFVDKDKGDPE